MGLTAEELLARVSSRELTEWAAYERVAGPIGPAREDLHHARLLAHLANINRGKKQKAAKPEDFMIHWDPEGERRQRQQAPMSGADILKAVRSANRRMGGARGDAG